ncbi:MAG: hypothetical protein HW414_516 [Dehalococcoidia bacterium]|nr:hypothetical protein [Dehalococcoidia bacterium]
MSQLAAKLKEAARPGVQPLGFKTHAAARAPALVLVARLSADNMPPATALEGADAVLIDINDLNAQAEQLRAAAKSLGQIPWGVMVNRADRGQTEQLKEAGCDFVAFPADEMLVGILKEEELGKVIIVPAALEDGLAAAINEISADAAIIQCEEEASLTVRSLLSILRLTDIIEIPVLVSLSPGSGQEEIEAMRQAGVAGIVLPLGQGHLATRIKELRQLVDTLPVERKTHPHKKAALLPVIGIEDEASLDEEP